MNKDILLIPIHPLRIVQCVRPEPKGIQSKENSPLYSNPRIIRKGFFRTISAAKQLAQAESTVVMASILGKRLRILVDSGAQSSILSASTYQEYFPNIQPYGPPKRFETLYEGLAGVTPALGRIKCQVTIEDQIEFPPFELSIVDLGMYQAILGRDWLHATGTKLDFANNSIYLPNEGMEPLQLPMRCAELEYRRDDHICLAAGTSKFIRCQLPEDWDSADCYVKSPKWCSWLNPQVIKRSMGSIKVRVDNNSRSILRVNNTRALFCIVKPIVIDKPRLWYDRSKVSPVGSSDEESQLREVNVGSEETDLVSSSDDKIWEEQRRSSEEKRLLQLARDEETRDELKSFAGWQRDPEACNLTSDISTNIPRTSRVKSVLKRRNVPLFAMTTEQVLDEAKVLNLELPEIISLDPDLNDDDSLPEGLVNMARARWSEKC